MQPPKNITAKPFWSYGIKETLSLLETTKKGLSDKEARKRIKKFGENRLSPPRHFSRIKIFLRQFVSPLIFILIIAGALTLVLKKPIDSIMIFLAVIINAALGFYQENRAEEALGKLHSYIKKRARVIRDGKEIGIEAKRLVPGDLIYLGYGTRVPADARLISVEDFSVDEAILTGESTPIAKQTHSLSGKTSLQERRNMVFGGTLVVEGYAYAVVTATGTVTELGKIAESVAKTKRGKTPLQETVSTLAWFIAVIAALLVGGILALGVLEGRPFFEMFLVSAAVAVGTIPEALPVALTVILAVGVEQIAKQKGIARSLAAAETLGSTTIIMTDKTGTLTQANMKLVSVLTLKDIILGNLKLKKLKQKEKEILQLAVLNTDVLVDNPDDSPDKWQLTGRALETHIFKAAASQGLKPIKLKKEIDHLLIIPFSSQNKFSASLIYSNLSGRQNFLAIVGAPDTLLDKARMGQKIRAAAHRQIERLSGEGKRLLGVGIMPIKGNLARAKKITPDEINDIVFMGLLSFYDPIRPGVPSAVRSIQTSGVKVVMATGDLKGTALAVARALGWKVSSKQVLTGDEIQQMGNRELLKIIPRIKVFARVTPEDKLRIGRLFKKRGEIVGMTGDGVNDAPALKAVNIGIAVGSGSDVAKSAADLVLLNDDFRTIAAAINEGRKIINNIRKSFVYLMSDALDEVFLIGGALIIGLPLPLTALQIIWVNFFTGSLPALSFAFDGSVDGKKFIKSSQGMATKDKGVTGAGGGILNKEVKILTLGIGVLTSFLLFALYWFLAWLGVETVIARTFLFACFASYTLFVAFSLRNLRRPIFSYNVLSNRFLSLSVLAGLILIAATIYLPFLQGSFGTTALSLTWLGWVGVWITVNVGLVELVKWAFWDKRQVKPSSH